MNGKEQQQNNHFRIKHFIGHENSMSEWNSQFELKKTRVLFFSSMCVSMTRAQ